MGTTTFTACKDKSNQSNKNTANQFGKYEYKKNAATPLLIFSSLLALNCLYWEDSYINISIPNSPLNSRLLYSIKYSITSPLYYPKFHMSKAELLSKSAYLSVFSISVNGQYFRVIFDPSLGIFICNSLTNTVGSALKYIYPLSNHFPTLL